MLPGMQAAFIDIGMERTAFLHASDIFDARGTPKPASKTPHTENIRTLVSEGNEILVQVVKDPLGTKGAQPDHLHDAALALPGVHAARVRGVGVSARIEDEAERERLRTAVQAGARSQR